MKRMRAQSIIFIGITAGLASCVSLIGGIGLEAVTERLLPLVPLIVALPALNTMAGDYAAIVAAHAGDPGEGKHTKKVLAFAVAKAMWVNIIGVLLLSIVIAIRKDYVFEPGFLTSFIGFVIISMVLVIAGMFVITIVLDRILEKRKLNPDDVLIPIVTSISDVMMLGLIALSAVTIFR